MRNLNKQETGFKFGLHRLTVLKKIGEVSLDGRVYRVVVVRTEDGQIYRSLRLYNKAGRFIKQMLYEPEIGMKLGILMGKDGGH